LTDACYHLVPTDYLHCQTPSKNAKFDLFGCENRQLANVVANMA